MASSTADPDRFKPNSCSNRSRSKVRIVAKIRGFTDQETESLNGDSAPWISVRKPNENCSAEKATISFGDQSTRETYAMDYCYEQSEDNDTIYSSEIKPLISRVFDSQNVTIIAYGARGSGKTYTIQGTREKQGLAALVFAEVLQMAEDNQKSVAISFYEVFQDHVYDLLDSNRSEVQVLEDAQGKIKLKGLSQAFVKSIAEFHKMYFPECSSHRAMQKVAFEMPRRSHKGLIIHIICNSESSTKLLGKIQFVDLAGYEDARRKSLEGLNIFESSRVNKSLYALLNVVHALNANEMRVPYRESKLTRMLQDSFGGTNHVVILTCLNPLFCQDTIYATSLASRSCQGVSRVSTISAKKSSISAKPIVPSLTKGRRGLVSATTNKSNSSGARFSAKTNGCSVKGRKLFAEDRLIISEQAKIGIASGMQSRFLSDIGSAIVPSLQESIQEQEESVSYSFSAAVPTDEESSLINAPEDTEPIEEKDVLLCDESNHAEVTVNMDRKIKTLSYLEDGDNMEKENKNLLIKKEESPPLSARLQELSNNLKSLYSLTPKQFNLPRETDTSSSGLVVCADAVEQRTPIAEQALRVKDKWEVDNCPSETYSARSSGLKHSLVQDYLQFLNSASKEELKGLPGIGEKRASYILQLREESPEPFKQLDDLKDIGLSAKQIKGVMKKVAGELFS